MSYVVFRCADNGVLCAVNGEPVESYPEKATYAWKHITYNQLTTEGKMINKAISVITIEVPGYFTDNGDFYVSLSTMYSLATEKPKVYWDIFVTKKYLYEVGSDDYIEMTQVLLENIISQTTPETYMVMDADIIDDHPDFVDVAKIPEDELPLRDDFQIATKQVAWYCESDECGKLEERTGYLDRKGRFFVAHDKVE